MAPPVNTAPAAADGAAADPDVVIQKQNFIEFVQQIRNDSDAQRTAAAKEHEQRIEFTRQNRNQQEAEAVIRRIASCDRSNPTSMREWLRDIDLSIPYTKLTTYVAAMTATGGLRTELEHFLSSRPDRKAVTWSTLKAHLQLAFLSPHEDDRLRHELEKIKQGPYETTASYNRRFRETADQAYPIPVRATTRNTDQQRLLLKAYMRGLKDRTTVERLVKEGRPENIQEAMDLVLQYDADDYRLKMALEDGIIGRHEEPMDIGAVSARANDTRAQSNEPTVAKDLSEVKRQVSGLAKQFTQLMATIKQQHTSPHTPQPLMAQQVRPPTQASTHNAPARNDRAPDGAPICHFCGHIGHVIKHCRKRQRAMQHQTNTNATQNQAQGGQ